MQDWIYYCICTVLRENTDSHRKISVKLWWFKSICENYFTFLPFERQGLYPFLKAALSDPLMYITAYSEIGLYSSFKLIGKGSFDQRSFQKWANLAAEFNKNQSL